MDDVTLEVLKLWATFYSIVGSAAAALTGLQFVVLAIMNQSRTPGGMRELNAYGTPTVVHFCVALVTACIMTAPWHAWSHLGACLTAFAALGVAYCGRVIYHARKATQYAPDLEDRIWYNVAPVLAHALLLADGILLWNRVMWSVGATAATSLAFLLLALRNAWDSVTYIAVARRENTSSTQGADAEP